jgi:hypothetical protein
MGLLHLSRERTSEDISLAYNYCWSYYDNHKTFGNEFLVMNDYDANDLAMEAVRMLKREERLRAYKIFQKHIGQLIWQSRQGTEIDMTPMFNELMEKNNE